MLNLVKVMVPVAAIVMVSMVGVESASAQKRQTITIEGYGSDLAYSSHNVAFSNAKSRAKNQASRKAYQRGYRIVGWRQGVFYQGY